MRLSAAHPDAACGLGLLGKSLIPLGTITFALSTVVSGAIASRVLFAGAQPSRAQRVLSVKDPILKSRVFLNSTTNYRSRDCKPTARPKTSPIAGNFGGASRAK